MDDETKESAHALTDAIKAILLAGIGAAAGFFVSNQLIDYWSNAEYNRLKAADAKVVTLHTADLNGNGILDRFYVVDGLIAPVEIDRKPISEFYEK